MKIIFDTNHLLVIENPNIPQLKEYTYEASGYQFSSYDKGIIVLHKKELKIVNIKNLGNTMSVIYIAERPEIKEAFDKDACMQALYLFQGFNETTGEVYYFLPRYSEKDKSLLNEHLFKLESSTHIQDTEKGYIVQGDSTPTETRDQSLSFLFGLVLVYGKFEIKNNNLNSIKVHLPLFGQFIKYEQELNRIKESLAKEGIFISTSTQPSTDGIVYQISSNDYELLNNFAEYYKAIENIEKIPKYDLAQETKTQLIEFISNNPEIPPQGKEEVIEQIKN
jgi:hypothetical protein